MRGSIAAVACLLAGSAFAAVGCKSSGNVRRDDDGGNAGTGAGAVGGGSVGAAGGSGGSGGRDGGSGGSGAGTGGASGGGTGSGGSTSSGVDGGTTGAATGPLRVDPVNPRYFSDPSGKIIFLAGSHTWQTLIDRSLADPPPPLDFARFLDFLVAHNHNYFRLWNWSQAHSWNNNTDM